MVFEIASWDEEVCAACRRAAATMISRGGADFFGKIEREMANNEEQIS
jgi:hypothetical protein